MGTKYRRLYMQSVVEHAPLFWAAPPGNIFAADLSETVVSAILSSVGGFVISSGVAYLTGEQVFDPARSMAWAGVAGGIVLIAPIAGETLADVLGDVAEAVARGWSRGQPEAEPEPPAQPTRAEIETEDELGAHLVGHWWYKTRNGQSHCYQTPTDKNRKVQISDQRMQAIFNLVLNGTPFSFLSITKQVKIPQPRFEILQLDWRTRYLYHLNPDKTGHLTDMGERIARAIVATPLPGKNASG